MEAFLNKLSDYIFLQTIIPGALIAYISSIFLTIDFLTYNPIYDFFIVFILGLIAGRMGSIIIEPLYNFTKITPYRKHALFIVAEQKDNKIIKLLDSNNLYRSIIGCFVFLAAEKGYICLLEIFPHLQKYSFWIILFSLLVIFSLSYRKQTKYIVSRIDKAVEDKDK